MRFFIFILYCWYKIIFTNLLFLSSSSSNGDRPRSGTSRSGIPEFVRPRILTLVRNGTRPRKVVRLLINRRNAPSMDHVLSCITEAVKLDTGAARKVFNQTGNQV